MGNVDLRRKSNFLIVDQSASAQAALAHRALWLRQALLPPQRADAQPPARPAAETSARAIEDAFKDFTTRDDIAVVLINQYVRAT